MRLRLVLPLSLLALAVLAATAQAKPKPGPAGTLDGGLLVTSWFGSDLVFHADDQVDYLWVKPGFAIDGHTFHFVAWPEPELLGEQAAKRDENDRRLARQMSEEMPRLFSDVLERKWQGRAHASTESGDVEVQGRVVDCSTGSTAAKMLVGFGAGAGNTTIDLKLTDAKTGELLAAMHHRVVSGTSWSNTDSKFVKWVEKLADRIAENGLVRMYQKGDPVKE